MKRHTVIFSQFLKCPVILRTWNSLIYKDISFRLSLLCQKQFEYFTLFFLPWLPSEIPEVSDFFFSVLVRDILLMFRIITFIVQDVQDSLKMAVWATSALTVDSQHGRKGTNCIISPIDTTITRDRRNCPEQPSMLILLNVCGVGRGSIVACCSCSCFSSVPSLLLALFLRDGCMGIRDEIDCYTSTKHKFTSIRLRPFVMN